MQKDRLLCTQAGALEPRQQSVRSLTSRSSTSVIRSAQSSFHMQPQVNTAGPEPPTPNHTPAPDPAQPDLHGHQPRGAARSRLWRGRALSSASGQCFEKAFIPD
ncbi:unnamed protein product [Lota lota]